MRMIMILFISGFLVLGCQKVQPNAPQVRASEVLGVGAAKNSVSADSGVHRFCDFQNGRCDSSDIMNWQLRERVIEIDDYLPLAAESGHSIDFLRSARARYQAAVEQGQERAARAKDKIEFINQTYDCHLRALSEGEQMTFGRELSDPNCQPLRAANFAGAAAALRELAELSLPDERKNLKREAKRFEELGPLVTDLATLKQEILSRGIVQREDQVGLHAKVAHIGHPFERTNQVRWLEAYVYNVRKLSKHYGELTQSYPVTCLQPACDPEIYKLADAVTLRPPLDWAFLRDGENPVAPSPYALSYFGQRYSANGEIREALGLNLQRAWLWNSELYNGHMPEGETNLSFAQFFRKEGISLTIADWSSKTEYTYVLPIFLTFQEARGVLDILLEVKNRELARLDQVAEAQAAAIRIAFAERVAEREEKLRALNEQVRATSKILKVIERIRELHFDRYVDENYVAVDTNPDGLRLTLKVLQPTEDQPIEQVRAEIYRQLPLAIERAAQ